MTPGRVLLDLFFSDIRLFPDEGEALFDRV
jgi:hypothetical protein